MDNAQFQTRCPSCREPFAVESMTIESKDQLLQAELNRRVELACAHHFHVECLQLQIDGDYVAEPWRHICALCREPIKWLEQLSAQERGAILEQRRKERLITTVRDVSRILRLPQMDQTDGPKRRMELVAHLIAALNRTDRTAYPHTFAYAELQGRVFRRFAVCVRANALESDPVIALSEADHASVSAAALRVYQYCPELSQPDVPVGDKISLIKPLLMHLLPLSEQVPLSCQIVRDSENRFVGFQALPRGQEQTEGPVFVRYVLS